MDNTELGALENDSPLAPDGAASAEAVPAEGQAPLGSEPAKSLGFKERFASDPEWAWEEFRKTQGSFHREQQRAKKLAALEPFADAVGGADGIVSLLNRYSQATSHPVMQQTLDRFFQTGEVPGSNPYLQPVQEDDPLSAEVRQLKGEVQRLKGERGVETAQSYVQRLFTEFPLTDEIKARVAEHVDRNVRQWSNRPDGVEVLRNLNYDTFKSIALAAMTPDDFVEIGTRAAASRQQQRQQAATDGPSRVATGTRVVQKQLSAADSFKEAFRQLGVDPHRPLM